MNNASSPGWRRLGLLSLAVLLVGGACSSKGDLVATVNGESIYMADIEGPEDSVDGEVIDQEGEVIDRFEFLNSLHSQVIAELVVSKADEEFGIHPDREPLRTAVEEEFETLKSGLVDEFGDYEAALESQGVTDHLVRLIVTVNVTMANVYEELAARAGPIPAQEVEEVFEASRADLTEVCATHVLLDTWEEAEAVLERAMAGEEISALAAELSVEPGASENGGALGCGPASVFVTEFAEATLIAELGIPYGPVESLFGHHVLLVTDRDDPLLADHQEGIRSDLEEQRRVEFIEEWFQRVSTESDVQIEPQYGRWTTEPTPQVLLPS